MTSIGEDIIVVFRTTHETLTAEKGFKGARIRTRTMVKPRNISSECALALAFRNVDMARVRSMCEDKGWIPVGYYSPAEDGSWRELCGD